MTIKKLPILGDRVPDLVTIPMLLFIVALIARFISLSQESFFVDEVITINMCHNPIWPNIKTGELNPPLYFYLLKLWTKMFGLSHLGMRSFSALAGALGAPIVYRAGRGWGMSRTAAALAALYLALAPISVWYGQQARSYALLMTLVSAWLLINARLYVRPSWRLGAVAGALTFGGFAVHYYFLFAMLSGLGALTVDAILRRDKIFATRSLIPQFIGAAAWIVFLPLVLAQSQSTMLAALTTPDWKDFAIVYTVHFPAGLFHAHPRWFRWTLGIMYAAAITMMIVNFTLRKKVHEHREKTKNASQVINPVVPQALLIAMSIIPVFLPFLISRYGSMSMFKADRYTVVALPALCLFTFMIWDFAPQLWLRRVGLGFTASLLFIPAAIHDIDYWRDYQEFDWRGAIEIVESEWESTDVLVFSPRWMRGTYINNGGAPQNVVSGDILSTIDARNPKRVWLFEWVQNTLAEQKAIQTQMTKQEDAEIRINFPHIKLWEIPWEDE